jgi:glycerol-3-phosphate acyltransferase PlsY
MIAILLTIVVAYLIGSIPFAIVSSRLFGLADPRSYGSGNPGATNVLRSGHKGAAVLTLVGDLFKGWVVVWAAQYFDASLNLTAMAALAVFVGHLFPIFIGFKGGKGVATALGILLALAPGLGLATLSTWLIVLLFFRMSSLSAIASAVFAPVYYALGDHIVWSVQTPYLWVILVMSGFLLYRHRANMVRILRGTEARVSSSKKTP